MEKYPHVHHKHLGNLDVPHVKDTKYMKNKRSHSMQNSCRFINRNLTDTLLFRARLASYPSDVSKLQDPRFSSLVGDDGCYQRLRNFSITSKGVVNRGDSFRSSLYNLSPHRSQSHLSFDGKDNFCSVSTPAHSSSDGMSELFGATCKVLVIGSSEVGKSLLAQQFTTSEYICTYDSLMDDGDDKSVTVVLNDDESNLIFTEHTLVEDQLPSSIHFVDCYVVVYSVADRSSFRYAKCFLSKLLESVSKPIILVGNKTDLVRLRSVTTNEGRKLAQHYGCKFIETSACINYHVDELLVGVLSQIRLTHQRKHQNQKKRNSICPEKSESNADASLKQKNKSFFLGRLLWKLFRKSRPCDNLHVL
ncbi:GTP-binding protein Rit1-like [Limulus polyphemus]|uniref:GTP-binding protein Rit1-like n=1 Tax=Limulus polyphemus TaxID=6850 RepID=A0ABM1B5Y0_LIMPO|nr:GTP-binding protein Rit1-like [Limulus polyphemus]